MAKTTGDRLSDAQLQLVMTEMIGARAYSNRAFALQRQGRAATNAPVDGSEALVVGAAHALDPTTDWVVPQYREQVGLIRFGEEVVARYVLHILGHPEAGAIPEGTNVLPPQISLATQIPHAVGLAWGLALQGKPGCVLTFFGDGSASEGDFYEAGNLAGVQQVPVIFLCVNNQWAISTPMSRQTAAESIAAKAEAFGFPGITVDGTDPVAVHEAVSAARDRAVSGEGPSLIEAVTYRLGPHTTADDPSRYIPSAELAEAPDPVATFRQRLTGLGLWDDDLQARAEQEADERMDRLVTQGEALTLNPDQFFENVYAQTTPRMERQRAELLADQVARGAGQ
ncbi:MAG: pyruvate dehydrogenase (acetyl-transferring) E1 component subunit alpha [Actinomycetia bacterium]|nr:pyruvate dehydrogenase (acetyl-transferring) E1 component subunit alpha [Actinomycetes bacterium]